ncbi:hypothetical protein E2C01_076222 [Portunus trituberculatus]|uniref:Uncharacterized protein n=1 Tax=Portunus trituberculatus TaxID=210409 RepID=A0A5B7II02_PORTR|nr:hypothetical protein [Portunus trituberculatus]
MLGGTTEEPPRSFQRLSSSQHTSSQTLPHHSPHSRPASLFSPPAPSMLPSRPHQHVYPQCLSLPLILFPSFFTSRHSSLPTRPLLPAPHTTPAAISSPPLASQKWSFHSLLKVTEGSGGAPGSPHTSPRPHWLCDS